MNLETFKLHLMQVQVSLQLLMMDVEEIVTQGLNVPPVTPPKTESADEQSDESEPVCTHPREMRQPAPVMGKPSRYFCRQCGTTVDG